ncbi:hypothetical protein [Methylorubrum extorquens]
MADPIGAMQEAIDKLERRGLIGPTVASLLAEIFDVEHHAVLELAWLEGECMNPIRWLRNKLAEREKRAGDHAESARPRRMQDSEELKHLIDEARRKLERARAERS